VTPWTTLHLGIQSVHGGLEDRTFQYLFLRPVGRAPLLLGKWLASCAVAGVIGLCGAAALFGGLAARPQVWLDGLDWQALTTFCRAFLLAAVAYGAVAVLFGAWFRRPLVWAVLFVVGLQTLTANLPVSAGLRRLTIVDPLRRFVLDGIEPDRELAEVLWPAEPDFRLESIGEPVRDLAVLVAACLALALWSYCRTEYDSRPRE
jgi:ABC-type transport system involved in multi-copper enzyme maturation permease subunit